MKHLLLLSAGLLCLAPRTAPAAAARRFALVAGANRGPADRVALRYAISDADSFANVVQSLGGVASADCVVLHDPTRAALLAALGALRGQVMAAHAGSSRTEVVLYYSGHADEQGLLLGREVLSYRDLRAAMSDLAADVNIAVLDACASGAITRIKGGQTHPAFLSDVSSQMQGYAFLTSSSENEAAQESERIRSSYFTHALLSGLRGAADASGDGRITLNEAYQFAFAETLALTTPTQGGAQHPTYDIKMSGTGDVVMTDVRQTTAALLLGPELDGRFYVRDSKEYLVAELHKPAGRTVEIGLEAGRYEVAYEHEAAFLGTRVTIAPGQRRALMRQELSPRRRFSTRSRGLYEPVQPRFALNGRSRIEMSFGLSEGGVSVDEAVAGDSVNVSGGQFAMTGLHWLTENLALELSAQAMDISERVVESADSDTSETTGVLAVLFGARYYAPVGRGGAPLRPYLSLAVGPHTDVHDVSVSSNSDSDSSLDHSEFSTGRTNLGLRLSGGADIQIGRHVTLGLNAGATLRKGMHTRMGVGFSWGWAFGRGRGLR
jgi:hypothetical protein